MQQLAADESVHVQVKRWRGDEVEDGKRSHSDESPDVF